MIHCNAIYFLYTVLSTMWLLADDTNQGETSVNLALSNFVADITLNTNVPAGRLEFETPDLDAPRGFGPRLPFSGWTKWLYKSGLLPLSFPFCNLPFNPRDHGACSATFKAYVGMVCTCRITSSHLY